MIRHPVPILFLVIMVLLCGAAFCQTTTAHADDGTATPSPTATATATPSPTPLPVGSITVIEQAPCTLNGPFLAGCPTFTFTPVNGSTLPGFSLRANTTRRLSGLVAGQYQLQQLYDAAYPLQQAGCTSDRGNGFGGFGGSTYSSGGLVVVTLRTGENVICTFANAALATATATPPAASPTPVPTLFVPTQVPAAPTPIIVYVAPPQPTPAAVSSLPAAAPAAAVAPSIFRAPNTGSGGCITGGCDDSLRPEVVSLAGVQAQEAVPASAIEAAHRGSRGAWPALLPVHVLRLLAPDAQAA